MNMERNSMVGEPFQMILVRATSSFCSCLKLLDASVVALACVVGSVVWYE